MEINLSEHFTYKKLIKFTLPTIAMMIFTSIYGVVDGLFVSNVVGNNAFASINLIFPPIMMIGTIGFMIGTGGSALISKTLGEGDNIKANKYFSMLVYLEIILSIILTCIGLVILEPVAKFLGATEEMMEDCVSYGRIILIGITSFVLQIIMIYLLPYFWGIDGIWLAVVVAEVMSLVISITFLFCYRKKYGYMSGGIQIKS